MKLIGIGDNVCDKYRHLDLMFPGGQALNVAVFCKLQGEESAYLGVFGSDPVAAHIKHTLDVLGVDRCRCRTYPGENGYAMVDLKDGERIFLTSNQGGVLKTHPLRFSEEDLCYIASFDVIHTSNNSHLDERLPELAALPNRLSYDFSGSWKDAARIKEICPYLDFGFLSCSELTDVQVREQTEKMCAMGCKLAVATMGSRGAAANDGESFRRISPPPVRAVDTLGAGDCMAAGFLTRYLQGIEKGASAAGSAHADLMTQALENGARLSAETCMIQGAFGHGAQMI